MNSLAELVAACQTDRLKLPALVDALTLRGAVSEAQHRAELGLLAQLRVEGGSDAAVIDALQAKLDEIQAASTNTMAGADVTLIRTATRTPSVPPVDAAASGIRPPAQRAPPASPGALDDATVVQPASAPAPLSAMHEATLVKPASRATQQALDTPSQGAPATPQGITGASSGPGSHASSWQQLADIEGGEVAAVGCLLKGRFYLEKEIGRGGMGVVFKARDERKVEARDRDPYVAVKVLNDEFRRHPDSLISLQRESRRSQQLAHDNIVRVFDFDKDRTIVFMTMEYIDGSDLKQLIRERAYNGLPLAQARPLIEGMARALTRAHAAGVVHSDFKPANVMVTREGVPKVFDFGIARAGKHLGEAVGEQTVFDAGTLGALTPAYASLEMIQGRDPTPADDVYALGCVAFELLTGKHPFDKVSAEVAMKEGRQPPPVKGLTKHQYKVLCASVAFTSERRLKSAGALVEGLREIGLRERAMPYVIYGMPTLLLLAGGIWGWATYQHNQVVSRVAARFAMTRPDHYADEGQALRALDSLNEDDRKRMISDQGRLIQMFLLSRIDAYWDPAKDHYDYVKAQQVFRLRDDLQLYSPVLDLRRSAVEKEKSDLLNALDTRLARQIEANAIFENQPDNVVKTLARIRAIDPASPLLRNGELELKYDTAIGKSMGAGQVDDAGRQLRLAQSLFPDSARLKQRAAQLAGLAAASAPTAGVVSGTPPPGTPADARKALLALSAAPTFTAEWQAAVAAAVAALHGDSSPEDQRAIDTLATAVVEHVARLTDPQQLPQARAEIEFGLKYAPKSAPLLAQSLRLDALQAEAEANLSRESADAEVKSRIESMRSAAAADDVDKAGQSLARIRVLQPDNPFLKTDGPRLLADAYLGLATDTFQKGRYQQAADVLANGLAAAGDNPQLQAAKARYDLVIAMLAAGRRPLSSAVYAQLKQQLDSARKTDAVGLSQLEADMKIRGQLTAPSLAEQIDRLDPDHAAAQPHDAALSLIRKAEQAYARQNYSAAIAHARAALRLKPGDPRATQLVSKAQHAQQQAMNRISIQ